MFKINNNQSEICPLYINDKYMSFITHCADLKMGEVYFYFAKRKHRKQIEKRGVMK